MPQNIGKLLQTPCKSGDFLIISIAGLQKIANRYIRNNINNLLTIYTWQILIEQSHT